MHVNFSGTFSRGGSMAPTRYGMSNINEIEPKNNNN